MRRLLTALLCASVLCACRNNSSSSAKAGAASEVPTDTPAVENPITRGLLVYVVDARPYSLKVPNTRAEHIPLLVALHGLGGDSDALEQYFRLMAVADAHEFLVAYPNGIAAADGAHFWNATDACCNFDGKQVDDVAHIAHVVADVQKHYSVDPQRIFAIGGSNGGFMAQRLACDLSGTFAAVVSIAGSGWKDPARCKPASAVSVLELNADGDPVIPYDGGMLGNGLPQKAPIPSVKDNTAFWLKADGCLGPADTKQPDLDLLADVPGADTKIQRWDGCRDHSAVELWTLHTATHKWEFESDWMESVWAFLAAHPKR